jgi:uncharacterized protein (DUF2236 family)
VQAQSDRRASVSWRVNAERIVLLGWGRAILLQLAHPLIAAGVFDHSSFRASPWSAVSRLRQTVQAMLRLTFGTEAEHARTLEGIRAIHRRVNGRLPETVGPWPAGTRYSAEDPALVLWVHATLIDSIVRAHELLVAPLSEADRDAYCREAAPVAVALLARPEEVPQSWAGMRDYVDGMYASGRLAIGPQARELAEAVLAPTGTWPLAPATWVNRIVTEGLLPPDLRSQYRMTWPPHRDRQCALLLRGLRGARHALPDAMALWPEARRQSPGRL